MANTLLTPKVFANVMLKLLKNNLVMGRLVSTTYKDEYKKIGNTVNVKAPPEFTIRQGQVAQVQNVIEREVPVVINKQRGIDISFSSIEETLTVTELLNNNIMQAEAAQLAQTIDYDLMLETLNFPNWVGTPGQTIDSATDFFLAPQRLDELAVPQVGRNGVLTAADYWATAGNLVSIAAQQGSVANDALTEARLPMLGSVRPYMTQNVINLITGTRAASGASQVNGANQNVAYTAVNLAAQDFSQSLLIKGLTAGHTIKAGEVFSIANVYAVNPRSKATLTFLKQFVVLADATADGSGLATLTIADPIIIDGAYQNVSAAPADSGNITWMGTASTGYRQNAVFQKSAIQLVFAKLMRPYSGEAEYATDPETGVSIRYWRTSDGTNDIHLHRWDVLYGTKNVDRRLGTRVSGTA